MFIEWNKEILTGNEKISHLITHKFTSNGQEFTTKVVFEQYAAGRFGLAISREKERMSVGINKGELGLAGTGGAPAA